MKKAFYILLFCTLSTLTVRAQYKYVKFSAHKTSLGFTLIQGLSDGLRDASMFGRVKGGRWFNEDLHSWQLKYKDGDYTKGAAFPGSTGILVGLSDCPHAANSLSHISDDLAKVYMPNLTGLNFWQKMGVTVVYSFVRSAGHNLIYGIVFKPKY
jgi:hypothetical protein